MELRSDEDHQILPVGWVGATLPRGAPTMLGDQPRGMKGVRTAIDPATRHGDLSS
jgi:hypothetical protein